LKGEVVAVVDKAARQLRATPREVMPRMIGAMIDHLMVFNG
jgi:hypothetical protein